MGQRSVSRRRALAIGLGAVAAGTGLGGGSYLVWAALRDRYAPARLLWSVRHDLGEAVPLFEGDTLVAAGAARVAAYEAASGDVRWRRDLPADRSAAVSVGGGWVIVPDGGDAFVVVAAGDGAPGWRFEPAEALRAVALGRDGTVFGAGQLPDGPYLVARDGRGERWRRPLPGLPLVGPAIGVGGDLVVVNAAAGGLLCFAAADGTRRWRADPPDDYGFAAAPLVGGGVVVAASVAAVVGYDLATGAWRWRYDSHKPIADLPVLAADGTVVLTSRRSDEEPTLTVLAGDRGDVRWRRDGPSLGAALAGSRVCQATDAGVLLLDAGSGGPAETPLPIPRARVAGSGRWLCAAAGDTLSMYEVR